MIYRRYLFNLHRATGGLVRGISFFIEFPLIPRIREGGQVMMIVRAGIDKVKMIPPEIKQIDMELMKKIGEVVQSKPSEFRYLPDVRTGKLEGFNRIELRKSRYKQLKANLIEIVSYNTGQNILPMVHYERMDANLPRQISRKGINNENISSYKDFALAIRVLEEDAFNHGFGELELEESETRELEVNYNIPIVRSFNEYERVINYIASLRSGYLKVGKGFESDKYTGLSIGNNEWNIKIYDKKTDVKNKTGIDIDETLRIEFTFKTVNKIKSIFGDNKLKTIIKDDFDYMQEVLREKILDDVVEKIYKDIERQVNHATTELKRYRGKGGATAGQEYIYDYDVFDIEIVLAALKRIVRSNHYSRDCKAEINRAIQGKQIKLFGNINKLNEILKALGYKEIKLEMTKGIEKETRKHYQ